MAWAIIRGYTNIVRLFLDYGVDVETLSDVRELTSFPPTAFSCLTDRTRQRY